MRVQNIFVFVVGGLILLAGPAATAGNLPPGGTFIDDDDNIHEGAIEAIAAAAITKGCNPPVNDLFCPSGAVTRGQMAAFLVRALGLVDDGGGDLFVDDDVSVFESDIDRLGTAGITKGCNPPTNDRYCPDRPVTRGEMAAFLVRAFAYEDNGGGDLFTDDDGSVFEGDIDRLGAAGVTKGCNPPTKDRYCPDSLVQRGQMASFLMRALDLVPMAPPPLLTFGPGTHVVDTDIDPGVYRNSDSSGGCFWERLSGFSGELSDTITNEFTFEIEVVDIKPGDAGFSSQDCGTWSNDLSPRTASPTTDFGGGHFQVASEVAAGLWRNSDSSGGCFWERLSGFSGELSDTITNEFTFEIEIVDIKPGDAGFSSQDCGTWSKDLSPRTASPTADFDGGHFQVGSEVAPGLWRNSDSSSGCFWERLSGFSGELGDTITNEFTFAIDTVEIKAGDVGFASGDCGVWTKIG